MAFLASLISRLAGLSPLATSVAARLTSDPFVLLAGKPLERQLLVYDLPGKKMALANDPDIVDAVLLNRTGTFPKSGLVTALLRPMIGEGVFGQAGGERVRAARRMFIQAIAAVGDANVDAIATRLTSEYVTRWLTTGAPVPVCSELSRLAVDIVSEATLGGRFDVQQSERFVALFFEYHARGSPVVLLLAGNSPEERAKIVEHLRLGEIGHEMRAIVRRRFVEPLIAGDPHAAAAPFAAAMKTGGMLGNSPVEFAADAKLQEAVIDEISVMLLAGHETTASVLSWLIWELASEAGDQESAAYLIRGGSPQSQSAGRWRGAEPQDLIRALTREALRLYPPIAFFLRETTADVVYREKQIPAGSQFAIAPWTLHRHRSYWSEPDTFRPERWLGLEGVAPDARYIPFGKGARVCPGERFAGIELQAIVRVLLGRCRLGLTEGAKPRPLGSLTSRPDRDFAVLLTQRPC